VTLTPLQHASAGSRRREAAGQGGVILRRGFSLVELLVALSIMTLLLGLIGAAVSAARTTSKRQATQLLIEKLDAIVQQQFTTYSSRTVVLPGGVPAGFPGAASYRSWYVRRNLITADMPDRWTDVAAIASGTTVASGTNFLPITQPQRTYKAIWNGMSSQQQAASGNEYAGAECLFMIVIQGGLANCIDCGELKTADRGDRDNDGAFEFWDAWGNPIGYILWPAGLQLPAGPSSSFFATGGRSLEPGFIRGVTPSPALGMRPLIYSAGPDGEYGFNRAVEASNLLASTGSVVGLDCGNPLAAPTQDMASPEPAAAAFTADNITNLDAEAKR
jgi:prepilin-type N-terminal cleavage/methylation domain-containing protein